MISWSLPSSPDVCVRSCCFFVENAVLGVVRSGPLTDRCVLYPLVNVCSNFEKEFLADNVVGASSLVFLWPPNTFCYFMLLVANGWQFRLSFFFLTGYVLTVSLSLSQSSCLDSIYSFFYVTIVPLYPETLLIRQDSRLVPFVNEGSVIVLNCGAGQLQFGIFLGAKFPVCMGLSCHRQRTCIFSHTRVSLYRQYSVCR